MILLRWWYYLASIPTLLLHVCDWRRTVAVFLGWPVPSPFVVELRNGLRFIVRNALDIWVIKEVCLDREYDRLSGGFADGWQVIDIGAGLGDFAISVAKRCPASTVYAFEPSRQSFALLGQNLMLNGVTNVRATQAAVSGTTQELSLNTESGVPVRFSTVAVDTVTQDQRETVPSVAINQLLETLGIETCNLLKIDCEGAEYEIFFNAHPETLTRIERVCMEYHDDVTEYTHADLVRFLEQHGFTVRLQPNIAHRAIGLLYAERTVGDSAK